MFKIRQRSENALCPFLRNKTQQKMSNKLDILILLPYKIKWNNGSIWKSWNHLEVGCETERPKKAQKDLQMIGGLVFDLLPN